jgi:hypothetical protein
MVFIGLHLDKRWLARLTNGLAHLANDLVH